ncbi:hypothetical protein GGR54DRAFT_599023 [Hypoxylon sp. NC1633]|nr:hypothetical protein GGR54DRAFT_599023 [Hypoxylon sp. NC1633]
MSNCKPDPEIVALVRKFSVKVAKEMPDDPIAQALGTWEEGEKMRDNEVVEWQQWLQFTENTSDSESAILEQQCRKVAETWRTFKSHFPGQWADGIDKPPSIMTLKSEVDSAQKKLEKRSEHGWRRVKKNLLSFMDTLDGHKALFSIIPSGSIYTSLLVGVVSSVVKASADYEKTAEGFSEALADLGGDLHYVGRSTRISDSPEMKRYVVSLYVEVFEFLCHAMKWYQSPGRRLLKSWNVHFYDNTVEKRVIRIQRLVKQISREADVETQWRVKDFAENQRSIVQEVVRDQFEQFGDLFQEQWKQKFQTFNDLVLLGLGHSSANLLRANGEAIKDDERHSMITSSNLTPVEHSDPAFKRLGLEHSKEGLMDKQQEDTMNDTREKICENSQYLQGFAEYLPTQVSDAVNSLGPPAIPEEVVLALRLWIESENTRFLWVEGPAEDMYNADLSKMAMQICNNASTARIPTVLFFRSSNYAFQTSSMSAQHAGFIALLYSLIVQFINMLPDNFQYTPALGEQNFRHLDGSLASIDTALDILDSLMTLAPAALVCVIDGLGRLESSDTYVGIAKLVNMLRRQSEVRGRRYKLLFTTLGGSYVLGKKLDIRERVSATRMGQRRAGSPLPGAADVRDVRVRRTD